MKAINILLLGFILVSIIVPVIAKPIIVTAQSSNSSNSTIIFTVPGQVHNISGQKAINFIHNVTITIMEIAWGVFLLTFAAGWLIKGAPIPFYDFKQVGQGFIYEAVIGAFFLALGSTIFYAILTLTGNL